MVDAVAELGGVTEPVVPCGIDNGGYAVVEVLFLCGMEGLVLGRPLADEDGVCDVGALDVCLGRVVCDLALVLGGDEEGEEGRYEGGIGRVLPRATRYFEDFEEQSNKKNRREELERMQSRGRYWEDGEYSEQPTRKSKDEGTPKKSSAPH